MGKYNLSKAIDIRYMAPLVASANNSDQTGAIFIDMAGWDGILVVSLLGPTATVGAVILLEVFSHTAAAAAGAIITGASATWTVLATNDNLGKCLAVDVYRPQKRYIYSHRTTLTQVATLGECWGILYNGKVNPFTLTDARTLTYLTGV